MEKAGQLPNYEEAVVVNVTANPSAPMLPPKYQDVTCVPTGSCLYRTEVPAMTETCEFRVERSIKGVVCSAPELQKNPDSLWRYFLHYMREKPEFIIKIRGSHPETEIVHHHHHHIQDNHHHHHHHNHNGHGSIATHCHNDEKTKIVTDFDICINASHLVDPNWFRVFCSSAHCGRNLSFRDVLEQYTLLDSDMKEIELCKQICGWNLDQLSTALTSLVRSCGYFGTVKVDYEILNSKIIARSDSFLMSVVNSCCCWFFFVITFLWIIMLPIYCCMRTKVKDKIIAQYAMVVPEQQFYYGNSSAIANAVYHRKTIRFHAV